jgi:hypothetical protein
MEPQRRQRLIYAFIAVAAVIATAFGTSNGRFLGVTPTGSATSTLTPVPPDPVDAQPAPALFSSKDLLPISARLTRQYQRAKSDIDDFYRDQPSGSTVDDAAFAKWAAKQVGLRSFAQVDIPRSAKRDRAARWLGLHGCRDVWTSYVLAQKRFHGAGDPVAKKSELATVLDLAVRITTSARKQFAPDKDVAARAPCTPRGAGAREACDCSFPSSTAAMSAAARTYLAALEPRASRQYAWMERQVDLAQVYQGSELPGDTEAGAYIGYLVGRYFVASRGYPEPTPTATTPLTP